jgi:hypothetical protein
MLKRGDRPARPRKPAPNPRASPISCEAADRRGLLVISGQSHSHAEFINMAARGFLLGSGERNTNDQTGDLGKKFFF